jgi:hypothetical protein
MIKNKINFNNKKGVITVTAAAAAASLLVASIATIGAAPFSYQQPASDRQGPRITSANIVDGEVRNQDLANDAVTSDKIKDGEVKEEDLDPSLRDGGGSTNNLNVQVTERSNRETLDPGNGGRFFTVSVQCNSDEVVTGGGFSEDFAGDLNIFKSKKQDNGWAITFRTVGDENRVSVHAECLKIVNTGTTG